MSRDELIRHLESGQSLMCELEASDAKRRRFAFAIHAVDDVASTKPDSEDRLFSIGALELPSELLEAEAAGEVRDQADCRTWVTQQTARGASEALAMLYSVMEKRKVLQPLQDEYDFKPIVLL